MHVLTDFIQWLNRLVNQFVWGPVMLCLFLLTGLLFSVKTGFFQLTGMKIWLSATLGSLLHRKSDPSKPARDKQTISPFQSLCTALAATLGTGNIAGVATAIVCGGPGAVFWMWISAFLGMMTSFAEKTLAIKYRYKNSSGRLVGGAMAYMEKGLGLKWMACLFAFFCVLASFGIGNMAQANSISNALESSFHIPGWITGLLLAAFAGFVIVGGIHRIAGVAEKFVPFMAVFYMGGALLVILTHIQELPAALSSIFREAFRPRAQAGGAAGYGMALAVKVGISRGVFTNEAGLGSSVMVHSASSVKDPAVQGMWGMFEVFIDTILMCTVTALAILTSGAYRQPLYETALAYGVLDSLPSSAALTGAAFSTVFGKAGSVFVAVSLAFFAFSSLLGWSFYGEQAIRYLGGEPWVKFYKLVFIAMIFVGATAGLSTVWEISDTFNGLMALPNLTAVTLLSGEAIRIYRDYRAKVRKG